MPDDVRDSDAPGAMVMDFVPQDEVRGGIDSCKVNLVPGRIDADDAAKQEVDDEDASQLRGG